MLSATLLIVWLLKSAWWGAIRMGKGSLRQQNDAAQGGRYGGDTEARRLAAQRVARRYATADRRGERSVIVGSEREFAAREKQIFPE